MDDLDEIRAFNRFYTRELGLLGRSYLGSGLGVTEVRVLWELAHGAAGGARELAGRLALDEGQLSRLLAGFERRGWLLRRPAEGDARRRVLELTEEGRAAMAPLESRSREEVAARLAPLTPAARARLLAGTRAIRAALGEAAPPEPPVEMTGLAPGDAGWIVSRHGALYAAEEGFDASFEALVAEIVAAFLRGHDPARERGWIARDAAGRRLGSIFCVRDAAGGTAKLRLFFLEPEARGLGLGRRMLRHCMDFARGAGYRRMVLWTHESHRAACALYAAEGFRLTGSEPARSFGREVVEQVWEIGLPAPAEAAG